jgi:hypothetical protein
MSLMLVAVLVNEPAAAGTQTYARARTLLDASPRVVRLAAPAALARVAPDVGVPGTTSILHSLNPDESWALSMTRRIIVSTLGSVAWPELTARSLVEVTYWRYIPWSATF